MPYKPICLLSSTVHILVTDNTSFYLIVLLYSLSVWQRSEKYLTWVLFLIIWKIFAKYTPQTKGRRNKQKIRQPMSPPFVFRIHFHLFIFPTFLSIFSQIGCNYTHVAKQIPTSIYYYSLMAIVTIIYISIHLHVEFYRLCLLIVTIIYISFHLLV